MGFDDLPLNRPPAPPTRPVSTQSSPARWLIVGAGTVIAGSLLALWWWSRAQPPAVTPAPTSAADAAARPGRPQRQPGGQLPPLPESDAMFRDVVGMVSRHPLLTRLLATRGLVRTIALAVVQIGDGKTPAVPLDPIRPDVRLDIAGAERGAVTPAGFGRWDGAVRALQSVPPADAAQIYVNVKQLFDEAYRELGFPDGDFDQAIVKAIRVLVATPDAPASMVLLKRDGYFEHEDSALQTLAPVQKQLLLLGPDYRGQVLAWLRHLAAILELRLTE